jgi:hypothetical protein
MTCAAAQKLALDSVDKLDNNDFGKWLVLRGKNNYIPKRITVWKFCKINLM